MSELIQVEPEYIYVTVPAEYICVYHRILAMMADYGEEMLKNCKASCTDKNNNVIECFNMFNAAVSARKLGKTKLAETIIKYVKAKINQIYKGFDNSTSFVFPIDENGEIKAFISCGERPRFEINPNDGELYEHKLGNGFTEHFSLGPEDESKDTIEAEPPAITKGLDIIMIPHFDYANGAVHPWAEITILYDEEEVNIQDTMYQHYFDGQAVDLFEVITNPSTGVHNFKLVVTYKNETKIKSIDKYYEATN